MVSRTRNAARLASARIPQPSQLSEIYAELLALDFVEGCYIGHRRKGGRLTKELTVVACVREKIGVRRLARKERVPKKVKWPHTSRHIASLSTDVQTIGESEFHTVLGPGDGVRGVAFPLSPARAAAGTIGIGMAHPVYGPVVTTAGHVFVGSTPGVIEYPNGGTPIVALENGNGSPLTEGLLRKTVLVREADYALVSPGPGTDIKNLYQDVYPLGTPYVADDSDVGTAAFVLRAGGLFPTRIRGIHAQFTLQGVPLVDLIIADQSTAGGDSGTCLVGTTSRPMGLAEGATSLDGKVVSLFTSIAWPFMRERSHIL